MVVLDLIAQVAARCPGAIAVEDPDSRLTYAELELRSNAIANRLAARAICPARFVGICTQPSVTP